MERPKKHLPKLLVGVMALAALIIPGIVRAAPATRPAAILTSANQASFAWPSQVAVVSSNGPNGQQVQDTAFLSTCNDFNTSIFGCYHIEPYTPAIGLQSAWLEQAEVSLSTVNDAKFAVKYLATVYSTPDQAKARQDDFLKKNTDQYNPAQNCTNGIYVGQYFVPLTDLTGNCTYIVTQGRLNGENVELLYVDFYVANAFGELVMAPKDADLAVPGEQSTFGSDLVAILSTAQRTMVNANTTNSGPPVLPTATMIPPVGPPVAPTSTPIPTATLQPHPTFSPPIQNPSIRIQSMKIVQSKKTTSTLKSGVPATFVVDTQYSNPGTNTPAASVTFLEKNKAIGTQQMQLVTGFGGPGTAEFALGVKFSKFKKTASLTWTVTASLGSALDNNSATFKIKPNCKTTQGKKKCK